MTQTVNGGEMLRVLASQEYAVAGAGSENTAAGVFELQHIRLDCSSLTGVRHFLATSPTLKRMAAQPVVGLLARALRGWARKTAKRHVLHREISPNLVTTEGRDHILSVVLGGGTQVNPWYVAPFEGNYTPVAGLTAATFTANATECTAYDEAARVTYVEAAPSGGVITNAASRAEFTFNATKTIYGAALLSVSTKSSTSGTCLAAARFSTARSVVDDDVLAIAYSLTLTSS